MKRTIYAISAVFICVCANASWFSKSETKPDAAAQAADSIKENPASQGMDNAISDPISKPDYDKLSAELTQELGLQPEQERNVKEALAKHMEQYEKLAAGYGDTAARLKKEREDLLNLRKEMQKIVDNIPSVIMEKLEADQKDAYRKILDREKSAQEASAAVTSSTAPVPAQ